MFWTCHSDVILRLGWEGITSNLRRFLLSNFFENSISWKIRMFLTNLFLSKNATRLSCRISTRQEVGILNPISVGAISDSEYAFMPDCM